jgi:predicted porin
MNKSIETTEMKKTLVTLAAVAAAGAAFAQSTVTISGSVAAAYERYSVGGNARITGFDASANSVTFSGSEDLGGGLKAAFTLNKRFNTADGSGYNAREFENAFLTVSGGFGAVSVGRHQAISVSAYDTFGGLGIRVWNPAGVGTANDYGYNNAAGSRYDDAISYTTPRFSGFNATLVTTKNPANTARESAAVRLAYANGPLSVAYVRENVGAKTGDVLRADQNLGLSYDFKVAKALLLWGQEGSADSRTSVGVIVPVGSVMVKAQYRSEGQTVNAAGVRSVMPAAWALGAEYALSKRTGVFAHFGDYDNSVQSAYRVGLMHSF